MFIPTVLIFNIFLLTLFNHGSSQLNKNPAAPLLDVNHLEGTRMLLLMGNGSHSTNVVSTASASAIAREWLVVATCALEATIAQVRKNLHG